MEIVNDNNFESEVLNASKPVLVDFFATWCGPCKMLSPILEQVAKERPNILIGKVNIDFEQIVSKEYNVWTIPTIIIFKNGKEYLRTLGFKTKEMLLELIDSVK